MDILNFQGHNKWLSNFYEARIEYEGITFPTTEHAYQASKTLNKSVRRAIAILPIPSQAMHIGRELKIREDWDLIKLTIMKDVNRLKFQCHGHLQAKLLSTDGLLMEGNEHKDTFWGVCNGVGENNLGKILMQIREELKHG